MHWLRTRDRTQWAMLLAMVVLLAVLLAADEWVSAGTMALGALLGYVAARLL